MKQLFSLIIVLIFFQFSWAQTRSEIDSLNSLTVQDSNISSDSLLIIFQTNLKNSEKLNYENGIADSYWQLSTVYSYRGKQDLAIEYMLKAIRAYEKAGNTEKAADSYGELGYKLKREDMDKAQYYMIKGRNIAESGNYRFIQSRIYNNYGVLKEMQGQLDSAEYFYRKGLNIVLEDNYEIGIPYSYSNLAGVYGQQGKHDSARYYFEKSKTIRLKNRDRKGVAENFTQIGEVYLAENKARPAINNFQKSLPLALDEDYNFLAQYTYQKISEAYKMLNQTDSALFYLERYNLFKDSINNIEVQKKIAELNVEFETEKKENEILRQNGQLIENDLKIERRNFTIFGILALLILGGLLAYLIINRQKNEKKQLAKEKELEVALAKLETQDKLEKQRLKISRDLHDNIGSQLTFITSSLDNLKLRAKSSDTILTEKIENIRIFTAKTINELRDTIWAMNKEMISMDELEGRLSELMVQAQKMNPEIEYILKTEISNSSYEFTALEGINIFRIIQEAINNATKYSGTEKVFVEVVERSDYWHFKVEDLGNGFNKTKNNMGNGLKNMERRSREAGAHYSIDTSPTGTKVLIKKQK